MPDRDDSSVIMLVDDDDIALAALSALFTLETDYQILSFREPREALEEARRAPLDLVISDFLMPQMNGLELLKRIQEVQPDSVGILLTGFADKENAVRAVNEIDLFQYLEKPWDNDQLLLVVRRGLRQKSLTGQLTEKVRELDRLLTEHRNLQERHGSLERELEMAARVHRSLLPESMPDVNGFGFSAFYLNGLPDLAEPFLGIAPLELGDSLLEVLLRLLLDGVTMGQTNTHRHDQQARDQN